jgi:hypothetical protein
MKESDNISSNFRLGGPLHSSENRKFLLANLFMGLDLGTVLLSFVNNPPVDTYMCFSWFLTLTALNLYWMRPQSSLSAYNSVHPPSGEKSPGLNTTNPPLMSSTSQMQRWSRAVKILITSFHILTRRRTF